VLFSDAAQKSANVVCFVELETPEGSEELKLRGLHPPSDVIIAKLIRNFII
jgi:hypothetical protein